jgi:uncharacterized membrane protein (UPF0182 family)
VSAGLERLPERSALSVAPPPLPRPGVLSHRLLLLAWALLALWCVDRVASLLADLWFFESVGLASVFWTNVRTGAALFGAGALVGFAGIGAAALTNAVTPRTRRSGLHLAGLAAVLGGVLLSGEWQEFLLIAGEPFGVRDPVFGNDVSFYVFTLPAVRTTVDWLLGATGVALAFSLLMAYLGRDRRVGARDASGLAAVAGHVATPLTLFSVGVFSVVAALAVWLRRYDVLQADNGDSAIFNGASYVDAVGLLTTINHYAVTAVVLILSAAAAIYALHLQRQRLRGGPGWSPRKLRRAGAFVGALIAFDLAFRVSVTVRDVVAVSPNEPVIQLDWIAHHVNATRAAYGLDDLETVSFVPAGPGDPLPTADALLSSATLRNAPLWPGFVSSLERLIDPQHAQRILQTRGDATVYGPVLDIFRQHEKLRPYYDFMDVDADRYRMDGEPRMFVTSVREVPLIEPQPWLAWWGQRFVLFTHGFGMVAAAAGAVDAEGDPVYAVRSIAAQPSHGELGTSNPRVYYGEGAGSIAYSNVRQMREFDFPTEEGRAELILPDSVSTGIRMDSFLKRVVFGWLSRQFFDIVFSRLIDEGTRAHVYRRPLERIAKIAPFLYLDTDPFAFVRADGIHWMVNGITHTNRYPNSQLQGLGDKSDERSPTPGEIQEVNYVRDAVKATIDAFTGQVRLYRVSDEPIVATWARVYPDLFVPGEEMPEDVRAHLQYPVQLFHVQFDDVYILYHMADPMTFFNMEDGWDDGDEVLGPILDEGRAITFSIEPYHWMVEGLPGESGPLTRAPRFALSMVFTPEGAPNLRAMPTVFNDPGEYGRTVVLQIPKGHYFTGPQQADAAIDQSPAIAQQFALWNRRGLEVIRGHTTALVIGNEILYVEPIFLRSRQQPVTQLKQVALVFREQAFMAPTLADAVALALGVRPAGDVLQPAPTPDARTRTAGAPRATGEGSR